MKKQENSKKIKKKDFYYCDSCNISSNTKNRMIPCPRGGCDAECIGEIIITREVVIKKT